MFPIALAWALLDRLGRCVGPAPSSAAAAPAPAPVVAESAAASVVRRTGRATPRPRRKVVQEAA